LFFSKRHSPRNTSRSKTERFNSISSSTKNHLVG